MLVGLVSDTHGVWDPALSSCLAGADVILHAGDVGNHGGHEAVLSRLRQLAPVHAVRGNVDDDAEAVAVLPASTLLHLTGWRVLLLHILASKDAAAAIQEHRPDIVVHGHSHIFSEQTVVREDGTKQLHINPGSAGPARFKLGRSAALMSLPDKGTGAWPTIQHCDLAAKAPPRLPEARGTKACTSRKPAAATTTKRKGVAQGGSNQHKKLRS